MSNRKKSSTNGLIQLSPNQNWNLRTTLFSRTSLNYKIKFVCNMNLRTGIMTNTEQIGLCIGIALLICFIEGSPLNHQFNLIYRTRTSPVRTVFVFHVIMIIQPINLHSCLIMIDQRSLMRTVPKLKITPIESGSQMIWHGTDGQVSGQPNHLRAQPIILFNGILMKSGLNIPQSILLTIRGTR